MGLFESSLRLREIKKCRGHTLLGVEDFDVVRVLYSTLFSGECWVSA